MYQNKGYNHCLICGKDFIPTNNKQIYCSNGCVKQHDRERKQRAAQKIRAAMKELEVEQNAKKERKCKSQYSWLDEVNTVLRQNNGIYPKNR